MRFWRWYLFLVIVCSIVAGTIYWWPQQPMWSRPMSPSRIIGFLKNGTQVIAPVNQDDPTFIINDVETGAEVHRLKLEYLPDWRMNAIEIIPGDQLFVGWVYVKPGTTHDELNDWTIQRPMVYQVIDSSLGKCIVGPFISHYKVPVSFSPDGKYFWSYNISTTNGLDLVETHTGKVLFEAKKDATRRPLHPIAFSKDSKAMAMVWFNDTSLQTSVDILDLPSGKIRFSHAFTELRGPLTGCEVKSWTDRLYVAGWSWSNTSDSHHPVYSFQVDTDKLSDRRIEPLRIEFSRNADFHVIVKEAGDKLISITYGQAQAATSGIHWLDELVNKISHNPRPIGPPLLSVKTINKANGKGLAHLKANELSSMYYALSPDGTRFTSWHYLKGLLMWNTQPTARWPWALGCALLVVLLLQYLRYRFTRKASSAGTPCSPAS